MGRVKADLSQLYTAVISDILDTLGIRDKVMDPSIRPMYSEAKVIGRAVTVLSVETYEEPKEPYKKEMKAVDNSKPGDVIVAKSTTSSAFFGELLATAARARGAVGVVVDGLSRDVQKIIRMGFPVFAKGVCAYDSKGRSDVIAYNIPIKCGGVYVNSGDFIFGDYDGVVVVPQDISEKVINLAFEKIKGENIVRNELRKGKQVTNVYSKYHIL